MKFKKVIFITTIFLAVLLVGCIDNTSKNPYNLPGLGQTNILTMDDLYTVGITNFVNKTIFLKTKVRWEYCSATIPEDPTPFEEIQKRICGSPTVVFDNIDKYASFDRNRYLNAENFAIVSDKLTKTKDSSGKEQFSFEGSALSNNGTEYVLEGILLYRDWLKVDENKLNNPIFIEQSNNPLYWSQTFEFRVATISK